MKARVRIALLALLTLVACDQPQPKVALKDTAPVATAPSAPRRKIFDDVDRSVDPCDDLYAFACNKWIGATTLSGDFESNDRAFTHAFRTMDLATIPLLVESEGNSGEDPIKKTLGDFSTSCNNEDAINKLGIAPFKDLLATIAAVHDRTSLSAAVAALYNVGDQPWFAFGPGASETDSRQTIWWLESKKLNREFYRSSDPTMVKRRSQHRSALTARLTAAGVGGDVEHETDAVIAFYTALAQAQPTLAQSRNITRHRVIKKSDLPTIMTHFDWDEFLRDIHAKDAPIALGDLRPLAAIDQLLATTPWSDLRASLTASLLARYAEALPARLRSETDTKQCTALAWKYLVDELASVYVNDQFNAFHELKVVATAAAINRAMADELARVPWLDPQTRAEAEYKRTQILWKIARPSVPHFHQGDLAPDGFAQNLLSISAQDVARKTATIGQPPDRAIWDFAPDSANANYSQTLNTIELPAGILQPPFFDVDANSAINLGAIGMVIGHELTHAFDDQGAQYDGVGSERNWWQPATLQEFKRRSQYVIDQYNRYPVGDTHVNGTDSVGENIADIGGLHLAFSAYRSLARVNPITAENGFSPDQQFFLSFAQTFCRKASPAWERWVLQNDVHTPSRWRINGAVATMPEFAAAFQCKADAPLAPQQRCDVW